MLPDSWIGRIFDHMSGLYGSRFADLWSGTNHDTVKRMWAEKLAGFASMPKAIKEALDSLDDKPFPPTLPEFLALCREAARRHTDAPLKLEYKPTAEERERAAQTIEEAAQTFKTASDRREHRHWAHNLKARHESGEALSMVQVQAYQEALSESDVSEAA